MVFSSIEPPSYFLLHLYPNKIREDQQKDQGKISQQVKRLFESHQQYLTEDKHTWEEIAKKKFMTSVWILNSIVWFEH